MEQMVQRLAGEGWRRLEINGGRVIPGASHRLELPSATSGYADAQIDDYGAAESIGFRWQAGATLSLRARFSHNAGELSGTAGFGFWNAPYGDPTRRRLAWPRAAWFFYASPPNDLPFGPLDAGHGWFAATINAATRRSIALIPFAPFIWALNQIPAARRRLWPLVRRQLGICAAPLPGRMRDWHTYRLEWQRQECRFLVDGQPALVANISPSGSLGFVCWIDNQYLILTPRGRFRAGVLNSSVDQWMEVADLSLTH